MTLINFEDFKKLDEYKKFSNDNPDSGYLKVEAFTAYGAIPVPNTQILITKDIGDYRVIFFQGYTDSSGMISNIELPAPVALLTSTTEAIPEYTIYDLTAIHEGYETLKKYSIGMFGGVNIIQYVKMTPEVVLEGAEQDGN